MIPIENELKSKPESACRSDSALPPNHEKPTRRRYTKEFREEAVQMMLVGHSAAAVAVPESKSSREKNSSTVELANCLKSGLAQEMLAFRIQVV